jgi:hypothetical protein
VQAKHSPVDAFIAQFHIGNAITVRLAPYGKGRAVREPETPDIIALAIKSNDDFSDKIYGCGPTMFMDRRLLISCPSSQRLIEW